MGSVFVVNMRFALYLLHLIFLRIYTYIIKKVYGATSLKAAEAEFERFKQAWSQYPGGCRCVGKELEACSTAV